MQLNNFEARVIGQNFAHIKKFIIFAFMLHENPKKLIFFFTSSETLKNLSDSNTACICIIDSTQFENNICKIHTSVLNCVQSKFPKSFLKLSVRQVETTWKSVDKFSQYSNEWTHFANSTENCLSIPLKLLLKQNCFATCLLIIPHHYSYYWQLHKMLFVDSWATNVIIICLWSFSFQSKQFALNNFLFTHIL